MLMLMLLLMVILMLMLVLMVMKMAMFSWITVMSFDLGWTFTRWIKNLLDFEYMVLGQTALSLQSSC